MGWNHRVIVTEHKNSDGSIEQYFQIHEVYYDKNDVPDGVTKHAIKICGDEISDIEWQLKKISECLEKPYLWGDDRFPLEYEKL